MKNCEELNKTLETRESYEQIATSYNRVRTKAWKECVDFIQSFNPGSLVLDVGCGSGRHTLASVLQDQETIGVDFSKNMLRMANKKLKSASISHRIFHLVLADVSRLPFRNCVFSYVLYIATLHTLPSPSLRVESLKEINRVLKAGGKCLISVWKRLQSRFLSKVITTYFRKIFRIKGDFEILVPWKLDGSSILRYFYLYDAKQLKQDIMEAQLHILDFSKVRIGAKVVSDNYFVTVTNTGNK